MGRWVGGVGLAGLVGGGGSIWRTTGEGWGEERWQRETLLQQQLEGPGRRATGGGEEFRESHVLGGRVFCSNLRILGQTREVGGVLPPGSCPGFPQLGLPPPGLVGAP